MGLQSPRKEFFRSKMKGVSEPPSIHHSYHGFLYRSDNLGYLKGNTARIIGIIDHYAAAALLKEHIFNVSRSMIDLEETWRQAMGKKR